jgi:hypothetical protein
MEFMNSHDPLKSYAARSMIRALPSQFHALSICSGIHPREHSLKNEINATIGYRAPAFSLKRRPSAGGCSFQTVCGPSLKCVDGPIHRLVCMGPIRQVVAHHSVNHLGELQISSKSTDRIRLIQTLELPQRILHMERCSDDLFMVSLPTTIEFRQINGFDIRGSINPHCQISISKKLPGDYLALVAEGEKSSFQIKDLSTGRLVSKFDAHGRKILQIEAWRDCSLLSILASDDSLVFFDTRIRLPIACHHVQSKSIVECIALQGRKCAIRSRTGYAFYDILSEWIPYFTISRNTDFAMANNEELILYGTRVRFSSRSR